MFSSLAAKGAEPLPNVVRPPRVVPRSLFSRSLLIVILPLLILQAVLTYIFYERHWDKVTRTLAFGVAGEVGLLVELLEAAKTPETQARVLDLARKHFDFAVSLEPGADLGAAVQSGGLLAPARLDQKLHARFHEALDHPFAIDTRTVDAPNEPSRIAVYVQLDNGLLRVLPLRKRLDSETTRVFIGWMFGLSLLLLALAVYFMTRQVRPILRLAWAMDKFGKGRDVGDLRVAGPTEIRRAGAAFNLMRKRILRHISQRTEMLAAVSHDLRTPLTRMKLELEMLDEGPGDGERHQRFARRRRGNDPHRRRISRFRARRRPGGHGAGPARTIPAGNCRTRQHAGDAGRRRARATDHFAPPADRNASVPGQPDAECGALRHLRARPGDVQSRSGLDRHRRRWPGHSRRGSATPFSNRSTAWMLPVAPRLVGWG